MISQKICLIIILGFCEIFNKACGQDCVPDAVEILTIGSNATLWWETDTSNTCQITNFVVDVVGDRADEYHFNVTKYSVDLSFLEICEKWHFTVIPVSHGVLGYARSLTAYIPLPPDADLTLSYFRFSISGRNVSFDWDLRNQTLGDCTLEYRLSLEDRELGTIEDVYVEGKSAQLNISPCINYEISLRAINQAHPIVEGPMMRLSLMIRSRVQIPPTLRAIDVQPTSFSMTWSLEGETNRCPLRSLFVDGGIYFNTTVPLQGVQDTSSVPVEIKSLRPNTMYYFQVYVENSGGMSAPAPIAVQTLDLAPN